MWPLLLALACLLPVSYCNSPAAWELPAPTNAHVDSYNLKNVLKWDPVQVPNELLPVLYHVECDLGYDTLTICVNITETQCNFPEKIKPFYRGKYKVRAELGERRSVWAEVPEFQASKNTKIGPVQSIVLEVHANSVTVDFSSPFKPVPEAFKFQYWLYYWKENTDDKEEVPLGKSTHHILENLEDMTVYCVQVKSATDYIEGQISDPKCAKTMSREYTAKELAGIITCVLIVFVICWIAGFIIYRKHGYLKQLLYPPFRMPNHMQEFLENLPEQPYEVVVDLGQKEEEYHDISVIYPTCVSEDDQTCADPNGVPAEKT